MQLILAGICRQSPHKHSLTAVPRASLLRTTICILATLGKFTRLSFTANLCLAWLSCCSLLLCGISLSLCSRRDQWLFLSTTNVVETGWQALHVKSACKGQTDGVAQSLMLINVLMQWAGASKLSCCRATDISAAEHSRYAC